jgi:hypothetical protein
VFLPPELQLGIVTTYPTEQIGEAAHEAKFSPDGSLLVGAALQEQPCRNSLAGTCLAGSGTPNRSELLSLGSACWVDECYPGVVCQLVCSLHVAWLVHLPRPQVCNYAKHRQLQQSACITCGNPAICDMLHQCVRLQMLVPATGKIAIN